MAIPIANIYYLLCYAWDEIALDRILGVGIENCPDANHLFARILIEGIHRLRKRGLDTAYVQFEEATRVPHGRILLTESVQLLATGGHRLFCRFDELSPDITTNRIVKTTVQALIRDTKMHKSIRAELRAAAALLSGVTPISLTPRLFHSAILHSNNRVYRLLVTVCHWLYDSAIADSKEGEQGFRDVLKDEPRMRRVFEKFVRNFYVRHGREVTSVSAEQMKWEATPAPGCDAGFLPAMITDVTIRFPGRTTVIECKYTDCLVAGRFLEMRLKSQHLYQIAAYLRNLEYRDGPDRHANGILLYPSTGVSFDQTYVIHGHRLRVVTLDLGNSPSEIDAQMRTLIQAETQAQPCPQQGERPWCQENISSESPRPH